MNHTEFCTFDSCVQLEKPETNPNDKYLIVPIIISMVLYLICAKGKCQFKKNGQAFKQILGLKDIQLPTDSVHQLHKLFEIKFVYFKKINECRMWWQQIIFYSITGVLLNICSPVYSNRGKQDNGIIGCSLVFHWKRASIIWVIISVWFVIYFEVLKLWWSKLNIK